MVKKVVWTPRAEKTNDEVIQYLQEEWSEKEVRNYLNRVNLVINQIRHFPLSFRATGKENVREALITKQNILFYRISDKSFICCISGIHGEIQ